MTGILVRTLIIALGLGLATVLVPGVTISGAGTLLVAALLLQDPMCWCVSRRGGMPVLR